MNIEEVAKQLQCSTTKISRIETGQRGAILRDVRELCRIYQVPLDQQEQLLALTRESKERAWWQGYDIDAPYRTFIGLESAASAISEYQPSVIPGLLQIPDYARAIVRGGRELTTEQEIDDRVKLRITRQQILDRDDPPYLSFIIDEAAIRRLVGGADVMRRQLDALYVAADRPRVTLQVIDYEAGPYPGMSSNFDIVEIEGSSASSIVYSESHVGDLYLEGDTDLKRYRRMFDQLRSIALSPQKTQELIAVARGQL
jgi:transcriptional regulator with XRE-family HTH domain